MTDTSTAAIAALMDGVTPGPWVEYGEPEVGMPYSLFSGSPAKSGFGPIEPLKGRDLTFVAAARELVPALAAEIDALRADLASLKKSETDAINEIERLRAFITEFAAADFAAEPLPPKRHPEDEVEPVTDAEQVWAWQSDAREVLKGGANG